tara:strand:+ start:1163 stop:1327 length:165 start_codon:yes stop_codon:yes gene_type:complete
MINKNTYKVTVQKGDDVESINVQSFNESTAKIEAIDKFYYDGWHAVSATLKVVS